MVEKEVVDFIVPMGERREQRKQSIHLNYVNS